jgi:ABC-type uncharacterized transport systems, ATPase components
MNVRDEELVVLRDITKRFPRIVANDHISISIKKGEIYALLGENGAGKSTLMSVLFGLYEPDEGQIFIRGKEVRIRSPREASALNIGMVHQHFKLVENQTVAENIILGMEPVSKRLGLFSRLDINGAEEKIAALSAQYGLEVNPQSLIETLPVSVRQRVEILKMLYRNAEILIFDEPTAVLTPQEIDSLLDIIKALRDDGKTIILITHKLDEIKRVADRSAILCRGKLVGVYNVKDITTQEMASLMVGYEYKESVNERVFEAGEVALEVNNLSLFNQDKVQVLSDVSFSVHNGEILTIAGVAGNGQVEVADIVSGYTTQSSGTVKLNGKEIDSLSLRERKEAGIAFIPEDRQDVGLLLDFDLKTNLALKDYYHPPFSIKGILKPEAFKKNADTLIADYDIRCSQGGETIVRSMSGGNQQKAIIAREIAMGADLYIFVQPTRGLDIGAIKAIHDRIFALRDSGKAILLVSLELEEVMELSDTILVMYNGKVQTVRSKNSLTAEEVGSYMMGVKHD